MSIETRIHHRKPSVKRNGIRTNRSSFARLSPLFLGCFFFVGCGDEPQTEVPPTELTSIAEARALPLGKVAKVEGFVTVEPGTFASATGEVGFALQDDTAGLYVRLDEPLQAAVGAHVRVEGTLGDMSKLTTLISDPTRVDVLSGSSVLAPKDVKTGEVNESTEGLLVRVAGKVTKALVDDRPYGMKVYVDDGSGEVQIFVHLVGADATPLIDTSKLGVDQAVEVTGFSMQYETTYEISPRAAADLVLK
ncbi:DNA-binding protein [Polyangium sp. 15x6]|uniref:DNA-binding protein n=1 Tax=Polyangium sp. 15x6 TaxID=3042687 RepID=UPI00249CC8C0|nr:DNA-binding protein [Polyangium sp. 15x6]MDI3288138.1 DNA-binding protein [Polyangium sp. 15x6]